MERNDIQKISSETANIPVYKQSAEYAIEHDELPAYRESFRVNMACRDALESAIHESYHDYCLDTGKAAAQVAAQFGMERVAYVLANTVRAFDHDGRISRDNKAWAQTVPVCTDADEWGHERSRYFLVSQVNPGLVNLLVSREAHNVITTGGVEIAVQEWADDEKTKPFENLSGVMPNTTVTKIAEVKNTGASDAWVRVKVEKNIKLQGEGTPDTGLVELTLNTADWTEKDGYYYYSKPLKPGEITAPIFTAVTFKPDMGNEYQNATATVDVSAQAVQTANNGDTVMDAKGWPNS